MKTKADLNTAGGRLKQSIELLTGSSVNRFIETNAEAIGMKARNFYLLLKKDELELRSLIIFKKLLPDLDYDYIITGAGKSPDAIIKRTLQDIAEKTDPKDEKIRHLTEKLKDRDKIISLLESYNKELLEKNDELRKRLGLI